MAGIIVIGASHGGVRALRELVSGLPRDFPVPIAIVQHVGPSQSMLPSILSDAGGLVATHAKSGDRLHAGHIFVAPPDHHLVIVDGEVELTRGPRENWARPSLDPLFRSAAEVFGADTIGIVLTGMLNDGTAGLYEIKRRGGIAIVQDPADAESPSMPRSALQHVKIDYCVPLKEIPKLLIRLSQEKAPASAPSKRESGAMVQEHHTQANPIAQTCPECGGAMREEKLGTLSRFKCHIGHVMTREVLVTAQLDRLEQELETLLRTINERQHLCQDIAMTYAKTGNPEFEQQWHNAAEQSEHRAKTILTLMEKKWIQPEETGDERG